jgi:cell wall assembly regulator SMI1
MLERASGSLPETMDRYMAALDRLDVPSARNLAGGLTDNEIDDLMMPTGLTLPLEARQWWRYHNGVIDDREVNDRALAATWEFNTLAACVGHWRQSCEIAFPEWDPNWFPLVIGYMSGSCIVVDCTPDVDPVVRYYDPKELALEVIAERFVDVIAWWLHNIDTGTVGPDPTYGLARVAPLTDDILYSIV